MTIRFELPSELNASAPPEARGLARDEVRLLVADTQGVEHTTFTDLDRFLKAGDLLVVNTSATLPAAVDTTTPGIVAHFSTELDERTWVVELRTPDGPYLKAHQGDRFGLPAGAELVLTERHGRLWHAEFAVEGRVTAFLARVGRPISYGYVPRRWPIENYQTVFGRDPGSAEMPSAGRPFTAELVTKLVSRGVLFAPILLHTGVSSLESHEPPQDEWFRVPATTARLADWVRGEGGRVIAVGTTVVRALESAAPGGSEGWTGLVLGPDRPATVVDGLVTGLHAPNASHLLLLEAVAGASVVEKAYREALEHRYLWHEFGDVSLLLNQ
ncbi:S-adenosylmethionine:tRNA ribosyltransferase-isomerase [Amycolatopsis xylanica]|uniref:S-adenosylmethionine:tRNA ribosyltransferase-isomerase n=1 Tax=Amycolatopsis xylanica TaxID=589385 RepID=A0A1H3NB36_9PSEU|nr:S-adenosylmethionine:tRNA ribosyltransferase-isomerase [Amycolatopsis xylanica]SDY86137.1 S-adenosylmethionine:tRNA ribosyltransferase-isomerase [Amycolatopsis xylanica]